ncbi:MAG: hypothetical protein H3C69_09595 [Candidatus Promineofilum sp.]|nr:hypothetical protein [Promineifilum sp.]
MGNQTVNRLPSSGPLPIDEGQRAFGVGGRGHAVAGAIEAESYAAAKQRIIINEQNVRRRHRNISEESIVDSA